MNTTISPEMLILARESRGITQSALSRSTSILQATISKYENNVLPISDEHLQIIANTLDYPISFFRLPERRYSFGSSCTYHRKRQSLTVADQRNLLARANILRIRIGLLLNSIDLETEYSFMHMDPDDYEGSPEKIAQLLRAKWDLGTKPISSFVEVIEGSGGVVSLVDFGTTKLDGISQCMPGTPPIFVLNVRSSWDRLRFTLAHELGHIVMHQLPSDNMEAEADRFAAEFLMPASEIKHDLEPVTLAHLARLKSYWRVSIASLVKRAYDLEKITHRQYRYLFEQMSRLGYRRVEPVDLVPETPKLLHQLVNSHLQELGYSKTELSQILHMSEKDFQAQLYPERNPLRLVVNHKRPSVG